MKKNNIFRRLVSLTVAIAMVMTIGTAVFAQNAGKLTLGQSYTQSNRNRSSRYYYTYTPSITGPYVLNARVANSNYKADIEVYTSVSGSSGDESFSGLIASFTVDTTSQQGANYDLNLTAGTTYYFRVRSNNINYTTSVTLKLNANYETTTINFNKNSSQASGSMSSVTVVRNQETTLPTCTFTRSGYTFLGWATSNSSTAPVVYEDGATITPTQNTLNLYAKWAQTATIRFNRGQGASGTMSNLTVPAGQQTTLPTCTFTKSGYTFAGWSTSQYSTTVTYADGDPITPPAGTTNLYAVWVMSATFNPNAQDATGTIDPITITSAGNITLPTEGFTRTGYGITGWQRPNHTTVYAPGAEYYLSSSTSFNAVWGPQVTLNANGGQGDDVVTTYNNNAWATLNNPGFTYTGYTLLGWSTSASATSVEYAVGSRIRVTAPTTLYAVWGATIAFSANGGTGSITDVVAPLGSSITLPSSEFSRDNCTLEGWSTATAGTAADYAPGASYTVNGNATLTAVWGCVLSFDANGGEGSAMSSVDAIVGATVNLPACTYTRTGYSTIGWSDSSSGTTAVTTYAPTQDTTLYVVWTARTVYTVSFNGNGADSGSMDSLQLTDDVTGTIPANGFTRDGYSFVGWATSSTGSATKYEGDPITVSNSDIELYAVWSALPTHSVTFDANGGEGSMSPLIIVEGGSGTIPACSFTMEGYTCIGWATDSEATAAEYVKGDSISITSDIVLYAIWEEGEDPSEGGDDGEVHLTPEQIREMNISHFVENLYLVALDRQFDVDGRQYWVNQIMNNQSGSQIVLGFLGSQEFISKNLSDEEYVTYLYRIFFDREPDAAGLENWTRALATGSSREDIVAGFAGSQEWLTYCALYQVNP